MTKPKGETPGHRRMKKVLEGIVNTLKEEGRYTPLLRMQAEHAATLFVVVERLRDDIFSGSQGPVEETVSREGNLRAKQSPLFQMFFQAMDRYQDSLKALGLNTDSKPMKREEKGLEKFFEEFADDR